MGFRVNGELFTIANSPLQRASESVHLEVEGAASAEYRLTELDQVQPAGYYRTRVEGDKFLIQRALKTAPGSEGWRDWVDAMTLMEISKTEARFNVPIDLSSLIRLQDLVLDIVDVEAPEVVWLGDGYGPTAEPVKYLAVLDGDEVLFIPAWR